MKRILIFLWHSFFPLQRKPEPLRAYFMREPVEHVYFSRMLSRDEMLVGEVAWKAACSYYSDGLGKGEFDGPIPLN